MPAAEKDPGAVPATPAPGKPGSVSEGPGADVVAVASGGGDQTGLETAPCVGAGGPAGATESTIGWTARIGLLTGNAGEAALTPGAANEGPPRRTNGELPGAADGGPMRWVRRGAAAGRSVLEEIADALFPRVCVHCRGPVEDDTPFRHLCGACERGFPWIRRPACGVCGHPFFGVVEGERTCPHCERLVPRFGAGASAVLLRGAARALVIELKYHGGRQVLEDMATALRSSWHVLDHVRDATLVPVPLHPRKQRERGFNQSHLIATVLAREAGGATCVRGFLRRTVDTITQTEFDSKQRRENLKNAFALVSAATIVPQTRYVLVDDVFTTGSTLNSCAVALRDAGAVKLDVVTFGHG